MNANIKDWLEIILPTCTLIGIIIMVYKKSTEPDIKADKDISLIRERCVMTHGELDKHIGSIEHNLELLKVNHLHHIEQNIEELKIGQAEIRTILSERFKN